MNPNRDINDKIEKEGFAIVNNIFSEAEIGHLLKEISQADSTRASFRKSKDLFAVRQFFKEVPSSVGIVFNDKLNSLIAQYFGTG